MLSEIIFHRETDSSGEASDYQHSTLERQRTITLAHSEMQDSQDSETGSVVRQNTMTLSREEEEEEEYRRKDNADSKEEGREDSKDDKEDADSKRHGGKGKNKDKNRADQREDKIEQKSVKGGNESPVCDKKTKASRVLKEEEQTTEATSQDNEVSQCLFDVLAYCVFLEHLSDFTV